MQVRSPGPVADSLCLLNTGSALEADILRGVLVARSRRLAEEYRSFPDGDFRQSGVSGAWPPDRLKNDFSALHPSRRSSR